MIVQAPDHELIFATLSEYRVDYLVVGGLAAALHGSPVMTFDVDIVPALDPANINRLEQSLQALNAVFRSRPDLVPKRLHLESRGRKLLRTPHGDIDMLGAIGDDEDYEALSTDFLNMKVAGQSVRVLGVRALIRTKRAAGRPKDQYGVLHLERLLEEMESDQS